MDKKKKIIIVAAILAVTVASLTYVFTRPDKKETNQVETNNNAQVETTVAPTQSAEATGEEEQPESTEVANTEAPKAEQTQENTNVQKSAEAENAETVKPEVQNTETPKQETPKTDKNTAPSVGEECTVMYIYSDSDTNKDQNLAMVENLKMEYADRASFNVLNLSDQFVQMTGFALPEETPKLIIITGDSGFAQVPNCTDESVIRQELDKILG